MSTPDIQVYRAIVQTADTVTGTLQVTIPALMGSGVLVSVANDGFKQNVFGQYLVPAPGTHGFVALHSGYNHAYWVAEPAVTQAFVTNVAQTYAASAGNVAITAASAFALAASAGAVTAASVSLLAHVNASDPHPQYLNSTRLLTYPLGRRNMLDNGDFQVTQRGGGLRFTSVGTFGPDRWYFEPISGKSTGLYPQTTNGSFNRRFTTVVDVGSSGGYSPAASEFCRYRQTITGNRCAHLEWGTSRAQPVTVSFEASAPAGFKVVVGLERASGRYISSLVSVQGLGARSSVTFPGDTGGSVIASDENPAIYVVFWLAAGSNYTSTALNTSWSTAGTGRATGVSNIYSSTSQQFYLGQVQAEPGSVATPYEVLPYGVDLLEAQRYFQMIGYNSTAPYHWFGNGWGFSTSNSLHHLALPRTMRANPTLDTTWTSAASNFLVDDGTTNFQCTALSQYTPISTPESVNLLTTIGSTSLTTYRPYRLIRFNNTTATVALSAEV